VDTDGQLLLGEPTQQLDQLVALRRFQRCGEPLLVLAGGSARTVERLAALGREVERMSAPIVGITVPRDETPVLEVVDDCDQAAGRDPEGRRQRSLRDAFGGSDEVEHSEVTGLETERRERVVKGAAGHESEARE
jgi:hypothetical protein